MKRSGESGQEIPEGRRGQGQSPGASVTVILLVLITGSLPSGRARPRPRSTPRSACFTNKALG